MNIAVKNMNGNVPDLAANSAGTFTHVVFIWL